MLGAFDEVVKVGSVVDGFEIQDFRVQEGAHLFLKGEVI